MDNIIIITLNSNNNQVKTLMTVDKLIYAWYYDIDIPANDDKVINCVLGNTQLYFATFGELMMTLTGEYKK